MKQCPDPTRYMNAGRVTQYEISEIRYGKRGWRYVWASLADEFHAKSEAHWNAHKNGESDATSHCN